MTIIVSCIHTQKLASLKVALAAAIVTVGFFIGVSPESLPKVMEWYSGPSQLSIIYGVLSSVFIALHAVLIKISLPHAHNSSIQLAYWQNLGSAIFLAPFVVFQGELTRLSELRSSPEWNGQVFVWGSIVTGVFGFLLCVAGLLSIKVTSPVTHMFSSVSFFPRPSSKFFFAIRVLRNFVFSAMAIPSVNSDLIFFTNSQAARSVIQTLLSVWLFHDLLTT